MIEKYFFNPEDSARLIQAGAAQNGWWKEVKEPFPATDQNGPLYVRRCIVDTLPDQVAKNAAYYPAVLRPAEKEMFDLLSHFYFLLAPGQIKGKQFAEKIRATFDNKKAEEVATLAGCMADATFCKTHTGTMGVFRFNFVTKTNLP